MSTAPIAFTGLSTFSNDFQSILARAVSIAQLPLRTLQNKEADLLQKKQLLAGVNSAVAGVGSAIGSLGTVAAGKGLTATSSNPLKVTVQNTGSTSSASYSISNVTSIATAASETSTTGYADSTTAAVSSSGNLSLVVGSTTRPIALAAGKNNLVGLRDAINNLGAGVTATIITTGTGATPNYLSVQSNATGHTTLALNDVPAAGPPVNLLTAANQGTNAVFQLNGVGVSRATNTVNDVVSGVTFTLLGTTAGSDTVNLSLKTDRSQLSASLSNFAQNYNSLVDQVNAQSGSAAGLLNGDFIIRQIQNDLQQTTGYQGTNGIKGLSNLGIALDKTGKASFDATAFSALSDSQISDAFAFLGSSTTGFGALAKNFTQISDPTSGLIHLQQDGYYQATRNLAKQITTVQDRVTNLQRSLTLQLQKADAALAQLQGQQSVISASIQSVNLALYGKNTTSL